MNNVTPSIGRNLTLAAVCALACGPILPSRAQSDRGGSAATASLQTDSRASCEVRQAEATGNNTIAVMPWVFKGGTDGARQKAGQELEMLLGRAGFSVHCAAGQSEATTQDPKCLQAPAEIVELPALEQMLAAGKQQGTRYVLAARAKWHTRAAWSFLSAKTKSTCSVDVQIADTRTGAFALYVRDVAIDSTASTSAFKSAAEWIPYAGVAVGFLSAGPKTPEEQRAVLLATSYALKPWIETWQQVNAITDNKAAPAVVRNR